MLCRIPLIPSSQISGIFGRSDEMLILNANSSHSEKENGIVLAPSTQAHSAFLPFL